MGATFTVSRVMQGDTQLKTLIVKYSTNKAIYRFDYYAYILNGLYTFTQARLLYGLLDAGHMILIQM